LKISRLVEENTASEDTENEVPKDKEEDKPQGNTVQDWQAAAGFADLATDQNEKIRGYNNITDWKVSLKARLCILSSGSYTIWLQ
jgi:hypothetical protein